MNENKGTIWKWAVALLVLCNVALVLTIWLKPGQTPGPQHEGPRDFVVKTLNFTDEQIKSYDKLIADHQEAMHRLRKQAMECRQQLFSNLKKEVPTGRETDSLAMVIANTQKEIELVTYTHFAQVRALCTVPQKATFDGIISDVIKRMNGGPRGDRPPGDRQGPPPPGEGTPPPGPPNR